MPHVPSAGGDDLGSTDEVKVFKDEGNDEDENRSSENLTEEKSSLIDLTESEEKTGGNYNPSSKHAQRPDHSPVFGKVEPHTSSFNMGYLMSPYSYANGAAGPIPVSMAGKMGLGPAAAFFCHGGGAGAGGAPGDPLAQPPPAHMGIPPYQLAAAAAAVAADGKATGSAAAAAAAIADVCGESPAAAAAAAAAAEWKRLAGPLLAATGLTRAPMYPFSASQYPYPMLSPEMSQVATWHTPSMYPLPAGAGFRGGYAAGALPPLAGAGALPADFYRFSPTAAAAAAAGLIQPHPGLSPHGAPPPPPPPPHHAAHHLAAAAAAAAAAGHAIVTPGPKQEVPDHNHRSHLDSKNNIDGKNGQEEKKKPHIKKPLNAFMLYMKEMRAKVVAECTLKESAAINQILGRRWHSLSREEQAKYYEKARQERQLHMQLYPGWSARDNYGYGTKKKKRKKERAPIEPGGNSMKKCRARYGLDQQSQWCKPCRRKKKCVRYMEAGGDGHHHHHHHPHRPSDHSDDNLGSCGSAGDAHTPPDDDSQSASSPGALSALSSLTSPDGAVLPSPSTPSAGVASPYRALQSPPTPQQPPAAAAAAGAAARLPVGANPRDANNPLSVNQLTARCDKGKLVSVT